MDPEQTAPKGAACSGPTLFVMEASQPLQQIRKQTIFVVIGALKVKYQLNNLRLPFQNFTTFSWKMAQI